MTQPDKPDVPKGPPDNPGHGHGRPDDVPPQPPKRPVG